MVQKIWTVRGHIICLNHDHVTGSKEVLVDGDPIEPITRDNPAKRNWLQWLDLGGELRFHLAGESCVIAIRSTLSGFSYELRDNNGVVTLAPDYVTGPDKRADEAFYLDMRTI
mmetsp:Transcript_6663/g.10379  ORF Transcript_6663/g.10379 Transcript_6663/m.10379 type:complete len:113 (-) Transcript_6663:809-1147(-)|eukprot:CAMPEP_0184370354 /NCGR_PEP_ID=MMETSP1089-20130417/162775_1 /TAXON_ID=38269 ORGANISM="Gloeochaete wittrockiana, Strain SAG46.84" /NCGR_SAMPLE_ID=MMETSP1089 /ASSEMBLY_ACC=CAM_ASM_000445 /LENGTH=112 /DNA_ID=CAMNT_0026712945 /DNA_START=99 /DNA_END=437 /DNA_ORIENTATION=-